MRPRPHDDRGAGDHAALGASAGVGGAAARAPRGEQLGRVVTFAGSPVASCLPLSGGGLFQSRYAGVREPTPLVGGVGAGGWPVGRGQRGAVARTRCRALRDHSPRPGRPAAPPLSRRLLGRARGATPGGPPVGCGAGVWARRRALPSQRRRAMGAAADRSDAHRRHRASRPPRGPGDPPAPFSFPRCPGHHQPPGHPDHDGQSHAARPGRNRAAQRLERALAQAERLRVYDHRAITDLIARSNGHRGTSVLARATTRSTSGRATSGKPSSWRSSARRACPSRRPTTPSTLRTTASASPTTTGRHSR